MLRLRKFADNEQGLAIMTIGLILVGIAFVVFIILALLALDMVIKNIIPIGGVVIAAIVLPIIAKGWYYGKTGQKYSSKEA